MKNKGSALILTLCVITLLSALTLILVNAATSAFTLTSVNAKKDQVYLMAESGVEKGFNALKQIITNTPDVLTSDTVSLFSSAFDFTEGNIKTSVSFADILDDKDKTKVKGVTITSVATNGKSTKKLIAYILKTDISNVYYETMFGNVITTLDTVQGNKSKSYFMQNSYTPMTLDGSMYLQGGEINIQPYRINYKSGTVIINSNSLITNQYMSPLINNKATPTYIPILDIINPSPLYDSGLSDFDFTGTKIPGYTVKVSQQTSKNDIGNTVTSLATFKIVKNSANAVTIFNWANFTNQVKFYIMRHMLSYPYDEKPENNIYNIYKKGKLVADYETPYNGMYKLYIIDGDISVDQDDAGSFINHIIYCTGTCYLKRGSRGYIKFSNSSIMAKCIQIENLDSCIYYDVNNKRIFTNGLDLTGIGALNAAPNNGLSPFSSDNRANINKFLVQHLKGYADAFRFKVYKWEES